MIQENLIHIEQRICEACQRAGRSREEVTLVAVSKTKPLEMLNHVYQTGIRVFGENKVQELVEKYEAMPKDIRWQMIGHLQRNKVKYIIDKVDLIHSVDSLRLLEEIEKEAAKKGICAKVLLEVNIAEEESKFGLRESEVMELIEQIDRFHHVKVHGLMTIAPFVEDPEENRKHFANLNKLFIDIRKKNIDNVIMNVLSMGMTNDFEVAIEEGATMVRIGTAIFGERNYVQ